MWRPSNRGGRQFISDTPLPERNPDHRLTVADDSVYGLYGIFAVTDNMLCEALKPSQAPVWPHHHHHLNINITLADHCPLAYDETVVEYKVWYIMWEKTYTMFEHKMTNDT